MVNEEELGIMTICARAHTQYTADLAETLNGGGGSTDENYQFSSESLLGTQNGKKLWLIDYHLEAGYFIYFYSTL